MSLNNQLAEDLGIFFNPEDFAEIATYSTTTESKEILVLATFEENLAEVTDGQKARGFFFIRKRDVPSPKFKDKITHQNIAWLVERIFQGGDGLIWQIEVRRDPRIRFT